MSVGSTWFIWAATVRPDDRQPCACAPHYRPEDRPPGGTRNRAHRFGNDAKRFPRHDGIGYPDALRGGFPTGSLSRRGCSWGTDGFSCDFLFSAESGYRARQRSQSGIGLPGKAAFANMTPIKVFQPKWHILSISEANWIERGGAKPIAI
jgi:hypothetical protein